MLSLQRITTAKQTWYDYMEQLMIASFPPEEYRALEQLRLYTDTCPKFHNNIILNGETPVGLLTYWDFDTFYYAEHFAIDPAQRNRGLGRQALTLLCQYLQKPIILEVEMPVEELAQRRINFYQRLGFTLWNKPYKQPPYKPGDGYLPMLLMAYGNINCEHDYETIKNCIYRHVYGVKA